MPGLTNYVTVLQKVVNYNAASFIPCALAHTKATTVVRQNPNSHLARQAREANHVGNQVGAEQNSKTARKLNHVGLGIGIVFTVLTIVLYVVAANMH
ncbi:hypothetical protein NQZ68_039934 [Dissostichus eleginoides]|nr:hypothetical protein NQZ68_039934 [Dissostichus eleginoides]